MNNQSNKFSGITKKHISKKTRNSKLKEIYCINEKSHLATRKDLVLQHSLKINKWGEVLISSEEVGKKSTN